MLISLILNSSSTIFSSARACSSVITVGGETVMIDVSVEPVVTPFHSVFSTISAVVPTISVVDSVATEIDAEAGVVAEVVDVSSVVAEVVDVSSVAAEVVDAVDSDLTVISVTASVLDL